MARPDPRGALALRRWMIAALGPGDPPPPPEIAPETFLVVEACALAARDALARAAITAGRGYGVRQLAALLNEP